MVDEPLLDMMRYIICALLIVALFISSVDTVAAEHRRRVLGASTKALSVPELTYGPGLLLPDNQLYFLDNLLQIFFINIATTNEQKALLHTRVSQERLAELRLMLLKSKEFQAQVAMYGITNEIENAIKKIQVVEREGKDVAVLARTVNTVIKEQRNLLHAISDQVDTPMRLQLEAARVRLKDSKYAVEDMLPEDELMQEIQNDVNDDIIDQLSQTSTSLAELTYNVSILESEASEAARQALTRRQKVLQQAIAEKNYILQREQERLLREEQKKHETVLKFKTDLVKQAKETVAEARKVADTYQAVKHVEQSVSVMGEETNIYR